jgi:hypothetical protein
LVDGHLQPRRRRHGRLLPERLHRGRQLPGRLRHGHLVRGRLRRRQLLPMLLLLTLELLASHVLAVARALLQLLYIGFDLAPRAGLRRRVPVRRLLGLLFLQRSLVVELRRVEAVRLLAAHGWWVGLHGVEKTKTQNSSKTDAF